MFDNVDWDKLINSVLPHIKKKWSFLIVKAEISKNSYSTKYYYTKNGQDFIDLYKEIWNDRDKVNTLNHAVDSELEKITDKFQDRKQSMLLTIKIEKIGNVKVIYKNIKNGDKLPYDQATAHLRLADNDKTM